MSHVLAHAAHWVALGCGLMLTLDLGVRHWRPRGLGDAMRLCCGAALVTCGYYTVGLVLAILAALMLTERPQDLGQTTTIERIAVELADVTYSVLTAVALTGALRGLATHYRIV